MKRSAAGYAALSVVGLELEYAIVDADMRPACIVDEAFRAADGRFTADVVRGPVGFSNELAAHVLELKTLRPRADLARAERELHCGIRYFSRLLRERFAARLLPTAMHPLMKPGDTHLWRRQGRAVYETYARVFDVQGHGWLNVQSSHVNLPFGRTERDLVCLYNAVACLLPYLPALAASSPIVEGRPGRHVDNRLAFYKSNQRRIPAITGSVVPQFLCSAADYDTGVLKPIYRALRKVPGTNTLRREWINSRGAILRFDRRALEIRVLDVQECVRMDVAIAAFVRATLRSITRGLRDGEIELPSHAMLVDDFERVITHGRSARVAARHFDGGHRARRAGDVLAAMVERAEAEAAAGERPFLDLVRRRLARGSLAELLRERVRKRRTASRGAALREAYEELIAALEANEPWHG